MMDQLPTIHIAIHGETAWSRTGQLNGMTDLPLTEQGESDGRALKRRLHSLVFAKVLTSSVQRVLRTCELAGFSTVAEIDSDLREWDYGIYEGKTNAEIVLERSDWQLFRDGCPHGESPEQITARADRLIGRLRAINDDVLLFSSADFMRALAVRWVGLGLSINARRFILHIASVSVVGYEKTPTRPVIRLWNDTRHASHSSGQHKIAIT